jgi:hypothetical protein
LTDETKILWKEIEIEIKLKCSAFFFKLIF